MRQKKSNFCTPEEILAAHAPEVVELASWLRGVVKEVVPGVEEAGYPGWKLVGYRNGRYFAFIAPYPDHIRLGFEHGITLPDPENLLKGAGSQVRYIPIYSNTTIPLEAIRQLIQTAALRAYHD